MILRAPTRRSSQEKYHACRRVVFLPLPILTSSQLRLLRLQRLGAVLRAAPCRNDSFINQLARTAAGFAAGRSCQTSRLFLLPGRRPRSRGSSPPSPSPPDSPWLRAAPFPPHLLSRQQWLHCVAQPGFPEERSQLRTQSSLCQPARNAEQPKKKKRRKKKLFSTLHFIGACIIFFFCGLLISHLAPSATCSADSCASDQTQRSCSALWAGLRRV